MRATRSTAFSVPRTICTVPEKSCRHSAASRSNRPGSSPCKGFSTVTAGPGSARSFLSPAKRRTSTHSTDVHRQAAKAAAMKTSGIWARSVIASATFRARSRAHGCEDGRTEAALQLPARNIKRRSRAHQAIAPHGTGIVRHDDERDQDVFTEAADQLAERRRFALRNRFESEAGENSRHLFALALGYRRKVDANDRYILEIGLAFEILRQFLQ